MSELQIRRIAWDFEGVDFIWNPANPQFAVAMNKVSFLAVGFEKYICRAIEAAEPLITDPAVLAEARAFRAQEGIHSMAHRKHVKALVACYPGLQAALDRTVAMYDELFEARELKYHLGYVGGLESIFTPTFKLILDNRATLFAGGDTRVASLLMWHFCEEIEHRSSGLIVYDHVVGSWWYRVRNFRGYMAHVGEIMAVLGEEFARSVPELTPELVGARRSGMDVPRLDKLRSSFGVLMSQMPWHDPHHQPLPAYFAEWSDRYERGEDMRRTYGVGAEPGKLLVAA